jgi:competence protein ComEC
MPRSWFTIAFLSSFLAATAFLQWWQLPSYPREVWVVLGVLGGFTLLDLAGAVFLRRYPAGFGVFLLSLVLGAGLAFLRVAQTTHTPERPCERDTFCLPFIEQYALGEEVTIHGAIVDEPDRRPLKTKYTIEVDELSLASKKSFPVTGRVLVTDYEAWPHHAYGDEVQVVGRLKRPTLIEEFHYDRYLSRYGIYSVIDRATVETLSTGHGQPLLAALYRLKARVESMIDRLYPEPHASLLAGLLTGSRRGMPKHLLEDFQATGLTHIIAISGYNITIVVSVLSAFLFFLPLRWRLLPSLLVILGYTLFVGASPSVMRAAIMGALGVLALHLGRQAHTLIAILLAATVMVAWNPKVLWYDPGFQLSFLSVLGLTYLSPFLTRIRWILPDFLGLREAFQMTIAAQLTAVPLVLLLFGQLSLVAPLANVLIALLIPMSMLFGALATVLGFLSFPLGLLIAYPGWGALELIIRVAKTLSEVPFATVPVREIHPLWVLAYYLLLLVLLPLVHEDARPHFVRADEVPRGEGTALDMDRSLPWEGKTV